MNARTRLFVWIVAPLSIGVVIFRPYANPELANVHPRIAAMAEPMTVIDVYFYIDGLDSCGFRFVDHSGKEAMIAVMDPGGRPKVFMDRLVELDQVAELANAKDTVLRVEQILRRHPQQDKRVDTALARVSGRLSDRLRVLYRSFWLGDKYTMEY
jgi:hypothetical protein